MDSFEVKNTSEAEVDGRVPGEESQIREIGNRSSDRLDSFSGLDEDAQEPESTARYCHIHPLQIIQVAENISRYTSDYDTITNARLVCTQWSMAFYPQFQRKARIHAAFDIKKEQVAVHDFLGTFDASIEKRALKAVWIHSPKSLGHPLIRKWFSEYGTYLQHVKIGFEKNKTVSQDADAFDETVSQDSDTFDETEDESRTSICSDSFELLLRYWCPNLLELVVPHPCLTSTGQHHQHPWLYSDGNGYGRNVRLKLLDIGMVDVKRKLFDSTMSSGFNLFLMKVFTYIIYLKTLKLQSGIDPYSSVFSSFISTQADFGNESVLNQIVELDFMDFFTTKSLITTLTQSRSFSNLKKLTFGRFSQSHRAGHDPPIRIMNMLFRRLGGQLEELELLHPLSGTKNLEELEIPILSNLRIFRNKAAHSWKLPGFRFLNNCPKLEVLDIWGFRYQTNYLPWFRPNALIHPCLLSLDLNLQSDSRLKLNGITSEIASFFPNLQSITIVLRDTELFGFLKAMSSLKNLRVLHITSYKYREDFEGAVSTLMPAFAELTEMSFQNKSKKPVEIIDAEKLINSILTAPKLISLEFFGLMILPDKRTDLKKIFFGRKGPAIRLYSSPRNILFHL